MAVENDWSEGVEKEEIQAKENPVELKLYPNNPRRISQDQFENLGKSMKEFGDLSGIVFNAKDGYLISGHQRITSLTDRYGKDAIEVNILEELEDEKRGFVEPEHIQYREVSWDEGKAGLARLAANKHGGYWDDTKLDKEIEKLLKLDVDLELSGFDEPDNIEELWQGMPEFHQEDKTAYRTIHIHFKDEDSITMFSDLIQQKITEKTKYIWIPKQEKGDYMGSEYINE